MTLFFCYSDTISFVIPTQEESHSKITPTSPFLSFRPCLFCHSDAGAIALENHSNFSFFVIPTPSLLSFLRRRNRTRKSFKLLLFCDSDPVAFVIPTQEESHSKIIHILLFCDSDPVAFVIPTQEESHSKIIHILLQSQHVFSERQISLLFFTNTYEKVFTYNVNAFYQLMRFLLCRNDKAQ
jgi:hypothetical protein